MARRSEILRQARAWLGCNEADGSHKRIIDLYNSQGKLPRGYRVKYNDAWCATFVSAVAIACNATDIIPPECGCGNMVELFAEIGEWEEADDYVPSPGDIIFYDWKDDGNGDDTRWPGHVGIVEKVEGFTITVIEGNNNDSVRRRQIKINGRYIRGYGLPRYDDEAAPAPEPVAPSPAEPAPAPAPTETSSLDAIALEVIRGNWGNGSERKERLHEAGYDADAVQKRVNAILKGETPAPATAPRKSIDELANEVIRGNWGNGAERRERLTAAGYDYATVQARVNEIFR